MSDKPTIHCQYYGATSMCGTVARYPDRAVVPRALFARRLGRRPFKVCRLCERHYFDEQRREHP
jgi:hypothetical protein